MISGTLSNRSPPALHFFRNYKPPRTSSSGIATYSGDFDNPPRSFEDEERWRALRSTIAAPTYFPPFEGVMDGGLICNNPTTDALTEITEYYMEQRQKGLPPAEIGLVVSIGTGNAPVNKVSDISIVIPSGVSDIYKAYKSLGGAANVGSILLELVTDSRMRAVDRPRAWCQSIGAAYFRLSPTLSEETDLGEARDEKNLQTLWETQVYLHKNKHKLQMIGELINNF